MRRVLYAVLFGLLLSGCAAVEAWVGQSVDEGRTAKDVEAEVLSAGLCAMGIGALNRKYGTDQEKLYAVNLLCYGQPTQPQPPMLDAQTLRTLRTLLELQTSE